jgi:hypothetical protein
MVRALATRAPTAGALASTLFAYSLSTACKADEKGGEETLRGRAVDVRGEGDILLSPLQGSPPPPALSPHPPPRTLPMSQTPPPLLALEQGPSMPIRATPKPPSPTAAPADLSVPPPTALTSQPTPEAADPAKCLATADGLPSPPPWPELYVFFTDPDRIVCRKCGKRHYNF